MSFIADRFTVILDANVLYPVRKRDVLLRFAEAGLFRPKWSERILEEFHNSLIENKPDLKSNISCQIETIKEVFPEAMVSNFEKIETSLSLPDCNDRHVLAAAILGDAQHIITENLKDFPQKSLEQWSISAVGADEFLESTYELYPEEALTAMRRMRKAYTRPQFDRWEFLIELTRAGMPRLATKLKSGIELL